MSLERARWNLGYRKPMLGVTQMDMEEVRRAARNFTETIYVRCSDSRERSLAQTAIEEACMWAIADLARNEDENKPKG